MTTTGLFSPFSFKSLSLILNLSVELRFFLLYLFVLRNVVSSPDNRILRQRRNITVEPNFRLA